MVGNLAGRIGKLEATAGAGKRALRRVVRLVAHQGEEEQAYRQAAEMGLETGPGSNDLLIIRLIVPASCYPGKFHGVIEQ